MALELHFDHGTLVAPGPLPDDERLAQLLVVDHRTGNHRAPAHRYREAVPARTSSGTCSSGTPG